MMFQRALARFRYGACTLVLELLALSAFVAALILAAPALFVLAAQLTRLGSAGDWRGVSFSEFLELIRLDPPSEVGAQAGQVVALLLALPATLVLFAAALGFWFFGRTMNRLKRHERATFHSSRQKELIGDIERAFEKAQDVKPAAN